MTMLEIQNVINFFLNICSGLLVFFFSNWITSILFVSALSLFAINVFLAPEGKADPKSSKR